MTSAPGQKRVDGFGNSYVYDHRERDLAYVYNSTNKLIAVKLSDWESWTVTQNVQQEGLGI